VLSEKKGGDGNKGRPTQFHKSLERLRKGTRTIRRKGSEVMRSNLETIKKGEKKGPTPKKNKKVNKRTVTA